MSTIPTKIIKQTTKFLIPITREEKLAITLRFLAICETYKSLMYQYRVSEVSISRFILEVSDVIIDNFMDEYMPLPDSEDKWLSIS